MEFKPVDYIKPNTSGKIILNWETFLNIKDEKVWEGILWDENLEIFLDDIDIINHDGMVWISYVCLHRRRNNFDTLVYVPEKRKQLAFLKLIEFPELRSYLDFHIPNEYFLDFEGTDIYKNLSATQKSIRKMYFIYPENWARRSSEITNSLYDYLIDELDLNKTGEEVFEYLDPFIVTINELLHNIILHSGEEHAAGMGIVCFNPYPKDFRKIRYCCSDAGIGIKDALKRTHDIDCNNDKEALVKALLVRAFTKENSILGLYNTLKFIMDLNGTLSILSGKSLLKINFGSRSVKEKFINMGSNISNEKFSNLCSIQKSPMIPGTQIYVDLNYK